MKSPWDMTETTEDKFLDGALTLLQPTKGYRAGADPVFLASAVDAKAGQSVLELGCGVGTALFCLMRRVERLDAVGIERNPGLAELARNNSARNRLETQIVTADLGHLPSEVTARSFDHVFANPPFFDRARGTRAGENNREDGRGEVTPLSLWVDVAARRLSPGGALTLIQRTERLQDILKVMDKRLGSIRVIPLAARVGRDAQNVIVLAKKGGRAAMVLEAPLILHDGASHDGDRDSYSVSAKKILREGKSLSDARLTLR
ncbi:MAG: methyltransferase [Boseongicola sp.]|nr:methyltransferase [Boseongicola sp.]